MNSPRWYVLYLRSRFEKRVHEELLRRGVESFLPMIWEVRQWSDRKKKVEMPLFPGYEFVRIELKEKIRVLQVDGVVRFVSVREHPSPVPDKQIESLKLIVGGSPKSIRREQPLNEGEMVKVKSGPFAGAQGIVVRAKNSTRVLISIGVIQQAVSVEVPGSDLEPVRTKSDEVSV